MGIKLFLNDYYDLLKFMHDNEVVILDEKVIPLTQQEIATTLKCSKMKINSMFSILQKQDYIEQKTRGKYAVRSILVKIDIKHQFCSAPPMGRSAWICGESLRE